MQEALEAQLVDVEVLLFGVGDGGAAGAVAVDAMADVMESLVELAVDGVLRSVRSVTGLQRGDLCRVAGKSQGAQFELELDHLFLAAVFLVGAVEATPAIHGLDG